MNDYRSSALDKKRLLLAPILILQIMERLSGPVTARRVAKPAPALGIVVALCISSGCSSTAQPPEPLPGTAQSSVQTITVKPIAFSELLRSLPSFSSDKTRAYLRAVLSSPSENKTNKQEAAYMLARILQKTASIDDLKEAVELFEQASKQAPLWERCQWHIS